MNNRKSRYTEDGAFIDVWPQRGVFVEAVKKYLKRTGTRQSELAGKLGTTLGTLRQWLYNTKRKPDFNNLVHAASVLECPIATLFDNLGATIQGIPVGETEEERVLIRRIAEDLSGMSSRQRQHAFEVWVSLVRAMNS